VGGACATHTEAGTLGKPERLGTQFFRGQHHVAVISVLTGLHWVARFSVHGPFRNRKHCRHLSLQLLSTETFPHGTSPSLVESHFISTKKELWITSLSIREILVHMTRIMASAVFPMYCNTEP
jgi:hypothetical protein